MKAMRNSASNTSEAALSTGATSTASGTTTGTTTGTVPSEGAGRGHGGPGGKGGAGGPGGAGGNGGKGGNGEHGGGVKGVPQGEVFSFTVTDGAVTAASLQTPKGDTISLPMNTGITFAVSGSEITATRSDSQGNAVLRFTDADADGLYEVSANSMVLTAKPEIDMLGFVRRETLKATVDGSNVTAVSRELPNGTSIVLLAKAAESTSTATTTWTVQNGLLVETHTSASGQTHWEVFRDGNGDGTFTEVAHGHGTMVDLVGVISATEAVAASL